MNRIHVPRTVIEPLTQHYSFRNVHTDKYIPMSAHSFKSHLVVIDLYGALNRL